MRKFIVASALLAASVTAAKAADVVVQEPVAAYNWSGVYVGGQIGYVAGGKVNHDYDFDSESEWNYRLSPRGAFGGIFGGYNYQLDGGVVLGVEGDFNWGSVKASGDNVSVDRYTSSTKLDWAGAARARVGYAFDRFMPYIAGGPAIAHFRFEELDNGSFNSSASGTVTGWTIGAGGEYAVTDNWTLRGEYRYTQYGKKDFIASQPDVAEDQWTARVRTHDLRLGVAYKF
jgi:outer membrane immunogenic protein